MKLLSKNSVMGRFSAFLMLCCAFLLAACGGGGGSAGTTSGTSGGVSGIAITLVDANGVVRNSLTSATPLLARAKFVRSGQALSGQLITFAVTGAKVTMSPSSGTVLTDASGVATVTLVPTDPNYQAGDAGSVIATATASGVTYTSAPATYQLGVSQTTISLVSPSFSPVSINAFGQTEIAVDVFVDGALYTTQPVNVSFNSLCVNLGKATLAGVVRTLNGRAKALYTDAGCGQSDIITATVSGSARPATLVINIAPPSTGSIKFTAVVPSDKSIVIKGSGGSNRTETARLTFVVLDTSGAPMAGKQVNFSVFPTDVTLGSTSGVTNDKGEVTVNVNSGTVPTTFRVTASIPGGPSTVSDSIAVTTGVGVQSAFSLSAETFNISGWQHDNEKTNINILIADASGNPVADGTAVAFQTDSGAVGTAQGPGGNCVTTNGACSVPLRSQAPRFGLNNTAGKRAGLATVTASSTAFSTTLSSQIGVFFSGDDATNVFATVSSGATISGRNITTTSCTPVTLILDVNDVNFNPMPFGTKVETADVKLVTIDKVYPDSVGNKGPTDINGNSTLVVANMAVRQGTIHQIPISLPATCGTGVGTETGTFQVVITSPLGKGLVYPFSITSPK